MKWIVLAFLVINSSFATEYAGLVVKFKVNTSKTLKNIIHKKLGTNLSYRSTATRRDSIKIPKNNSDHKLLAAKCLEYQKEKIIENCFPAKVTTYPDCISCKLPPVTTNAISALVKLVNATTCSPFPAMFEGDNLSSDKFGKQSPYWAQEAIGAPEAREFMLSQGTPRNVAIGIMDSGFSKESLSTLNIGPEVQSALSGDLGDPSHGNPVSQLVCGNPPPGISNAGVLTRIAPTVETDQAETLAAYDKMLGFKSDTPEGSPVDKSTMPEVINISMTMGDAYQEDINRLASNSLLVMASGNEFPAHQATTTAAGVNKIIVGSLAPDGTASEFSNTGDAVTICAPSDLNIQSSDGSEQVNFSGTSGATPLVTGALSNALSYLPGLTSEEAQTLLVRSSIITVGSPGEYPYTDGMGALNSYKLVRVAAKLKDRWPANRNQIYKWPSYDFKNEAHESYSRSQELLKDENSCDQKKEGLKLLREAFFLDSENNEFRAKLASIYREHGFESQARYVDNLKATRALAETQKRINERELLDFASNIAPGNTTATFQQMKEIFDSGTDLFNNYSNSTKINWVQIMTNNFKLSDKVYHPLIIKFLIDNDQKIDSRWSIGQTHTNITTWAIDNNNLELLDYLVKKNETVDLSEALIRSVAFEEQSKIDLILKSKATFDVNATIDGFNHSPFGEAVLHNDVPLIKRLLEHNPDPNQLIYVDVGYENGQIVRYHDPTTGVPLKEWIEMQDSRFNRLKKIIGNL